MTPASPLKSILAEARRAALSGGLTQISRLHFQLGPAARLSGRKLEETLRADIDGTLFKGCKVTWERVADGGLVLASIEGYSRHSS